MHQAPGGVQTLAARHSPLIGRALQRAHFAEYLANLRGGHSAIIMLTGPPGIGKSRILDELASNWCVDDTTVLRGSAWQAEGMPPYLPFLEALGAYIASAPVADLRVLLGTRAAILAMLLPEIDDRLGPTGPVHLLSPDQERFRLYEAVAMFLAALATRHPVVLLFDDLQWADSATCDLLVYVAGRAHSAPLLIVGAYREGEASDNPALVRALIELNRRRLLDTIPLHPLDAEESLALARNLLAADIEPGLANLLHRHGGGNPFFLEELVRALVEDGTLVSAHDHWELREQPLELLPPRVAEAIRLRLTRLNPTVVDLLRVAAVVGRTFAAGLVAGMLRMGAEEAEDLLLTAVRTQLVRLEADGTYAFTHDMVRETLYADVGREARRRLHQAIGEALVPDKGILSSQRLADLAFHFAQAGERTRGAEYTLTAGKESLRSSAPQEAMAYYRTAINLLEDGDPVHRAEAFMGLGDAASLAGDYPQAVGAYGAAQNAVLHVDDPHMAARALRHVARVRWRQEAGPETADAMQQALHLLGPQDSPEAAEVLLQLANLLVASLGRHSEGINYAERALAMVKRLGDQRLEALALCVMGNVEARRNKLVAAQETLERSLALAQQLDDPVLGAEACAYLANISAWTGDLSRSRELSLQRLVMAERTHDPFELRHVYAWIGVMDVLRGQWEDAERWFADQERALDGLQTPEPTAALRAGQGELHYYRGQFEEAERKFREAIEAIRPIGAGQLVWHLGRLGLVLTELRRDDAMAAFTELQTLAEPLDSQSSARLGAYAYLALGYAKLGERERVAACYESLLPFRGQFAPVPADRALGLAAAAAGDLASAQEHLAAAEEQARAAAMIPELALILLERGMLWRGRSVTVVKQRERFEEHAEAHMTEGLQLCERLGMQKLARSILSPAPPKRTGRVAGLTERELEVVRLVVQGLSNRDIGRTLFLSEHTVARHLTHIFTKTGVENRAGATAYALRHHVV